MNNLLAATALLSLFAVNSSACLAGEAPVDTLQYMLQSDDKNESWLLDGTDVRWGVDPEGAGARTFILNKFADPNVYEVYQVTDEDIQIRYEVCRSGGAKGHDNWIRRFEEIEGNQSAGGAVWMKRYMVPGGEGFISQYSQDRFTYDQKTGAYAYDRVGSGQSMKTYISVVWAYPDWKKNNKTGFRLDKVLRMISQWQPQGLMIETYDYAPGKGLVNWRWLERVESLRPVDGDKTGNLFHCENGHVRIVSRGSDEQEPVIFKYDLASGTVGAKLDVEKMTSFWRKSAGPQWYVVYRDLSREHPITRKSGRITCKFALPECKSKPAMTIADLPFVNTHKVSKP